jgi:hypothetical protein
MTIEPTAHDQELSDAISSATEEIIRHCHRDFNDSETLSTRTYESFLNPDRGPVLITDDFSTADGLVVSSGGITYDASTLTLKPRNGVMQGMTGWPYWRIEGAFPLSTEVSVTARWGWSTVPNPVRQACFIMAADSFQLKDQRLGIAGSDQFGTIVTLRDNGLAVKKLKNYRRNSVLVDG